MKLKNAVLGLLTLSALAFGCQRECISPETHEVEIQGSLEGIQRPSSQCGSSVFTTFVDVNNNAMGSVEILNTESQLFLLVDMNPGWTLQGAKLFAGNSLDLPKTSNGLIQIEEFPHQFSHSRAQDKSTFRIDISTLAPCYGLAIWGQAVQMNQFGHVTTSRPVWASGTTVLNGQMLNYCSGICVTGMQGGAANN